MSPPAACGLPRRRRAPTARPGAIWRPVPTGEPMQLAAAQSPPQAPAEPLWRRLKRALLYGGDVDHAAKSRARVGLAIAAFALVYAVIAARLVILAMTADPHGARRT